MQLIQNINASIGEEFWTPADHYLKPQRSDQVALGYFKNFKENTFECSAEIYYKWMQNTPELRENANIQFNEAIESEIVGGQGRAYGLEGSVIRFRKRKDRRITSMTETGIPIVTTGETISR